MDQALYPLPQQTPPAGNGRGPQINAFLTRLAVEGHVAASTQNQAFSALLFLYQKVLEIAPGRIEGVIRARRPKRLPVVLSRAEDRCCPRCGSLRQQHSGGL